jgi:peroxiredoxin
MASPDGFASSSAEWPPTRSDTIDWEDNVSTDTTPIAVGNIAPDFTLKDQNNNDVTLAAYKGKKNVVLCFYPLDWSPICTPENQCITRDLDKFTGHEAEVLGISIDSVWSHKAFADANEFTHKLLSDMHRTVCKSYGLFVPEANIAARATVIVDKTGKVAWVQVKEIKDPRDDAEIIEELKKLQ